MKRILILSLVAGFHLPSLMLAQGPLTPPGAPVPTMKTLDQVEPRIAINTTNTPGDADSLYKITQPGSYYLTGNITGVAGKHGIEIAASGVTLDLTGFDLSGVPAMGAFDGVSATLANLKHITINNGTIRDWGGDGIDLNTVLTNFCRVAGVTVSNNAGNGISVRSNATVANCMASQNGASGILLTDGCTVSNCSALGNTGNGLTAGNTCVVTNCLAFQSAGTGVSTGFHCTITDCTSSLSTLDGITVTFDCKLTNCAASSNLLNGISTGDGCSVTNCSADQNTTTGISVNIGCTISKCTAHANISNGISTGSACTVVDCTARSNSNHGILLVNDCAITACTSTRNGFDGIRVDSDCRVAENTCNENGQGGLFAGIFAAGFYNRIEGNHTNTNDAGISTGVTSNGNIIIRNTAVGNTTMNYSLPMSGNFVGTIITNNAAMNAATNSSFNISF